MAPLNRGTGLFFLTKGTHKPLVTSSILVAATDYTHMASSDKEGAFFVSQGREDAGCGRPRPETRTAQALHRCAGPRMLAECVCPESAESGATYAIMLVTSGDHEVVA